MGLRALDLGQGVTGLGSLRAEESRTILQGIPTPTPYPQAEWLEFPQGTGLCRVERQHLFGDKEIGFCARNNGKPQGALDLESNSFSMSKKMRLKKCIRDFLAAL